MKPVKNCFAMSRVDLFDGREFIFFFTIAVSMSMRFELRLRKMFNFENIEIFFGCSAVRFLRGRDEMKLENYSSVIKKLPSKEISKNL